MLTRKSAKKRLSPAKKLGLDSLLSGLASAARSTVGLEQPRTRSVAMADNSNGDPATTDRGEKQKYTDGQSGDEYYDDRLSRDSQIDLHLRSLGNSRRNSPVTADINSITGEELSLIHI